MTTTAHNRSYGHAGRHNRQPPPDPQELLQACLEFVQLARERLEAAQRERQHDPDVIHSSALVVAEHHWGLALQALSAVALEANPPGGKTVLGVLCDQLRAALQERALKPKRDYETRHTLSAKAVKLRDAIFEEASKERRIAMAKASTGHRPWAFDSERTGEQPRGPSREH